MKKKTVKVYLYPKDFEAAKTQQDMIALLWRPDFCKTNRRQRAYDFVVRPRKPMSERGGT